MFLPSKEIKQTLAEIDKTALHAQAALVTLNAILEDWKALSAALRQKLLDEK